MTHATITDEMTLGELAKLLDVRYPDGWRLSLDSERGCAHATLIRLEERPDGTADIHRGDGKADRISSAIALALDAVRAR